MRSPYNLCAKWLSVASVALFCGMFLHIGVVEIMILGRASGVAALASCIFFCISAKKLRTDAIALLLFWLVIVAVVTPIMMSAVAASKLRSRPIPMRAR